MIRRLYIGQVDNQGCPPGYHSVQWTTVACSLCSSSCQRRGSSLGHPRTNKHCRESPRSPMPREPLQVHCLGCCAEEGERRHPRTADRYSPRLDGPRICDLRRSMRWNHSRCQHYVMYRGDAVDGMLSQQQEGHLGGGTRPQTLPVFQRGVDQRGCCHQGTADTRGRCEARYGAAGGFD